MAAGSWRRSGAALGALLRLGTEAVAWSPLDDARAGRPFELLLPLPGSRRSLGRDPGEWVDEWSKTAVNHHWALGTGHRLGELRAVAELLNIEVVSL